MSDSGPPIGRRTLEIEFASVDVRHLREALAQRIETNDVGVHLADSHGHRVDAALQFGLEFLDLGLLLGEGFGPGGNPARRGFALADLESEAESGGENGDQHRRESRNGERMCQVEMPGTTFAAREKNDVHRASSEAIGHSGSLRSCSLYFKDLHLAGILVVLSLRVLDRQNRKAQQARNYAQKTYPKQAIDPPGVKTRDGGRLNLGSSASSRPACPFGVRRVRVAGRSNEGLGARPRQ